MILDLVHFRHESTGDFGTRFGHGKFCIDCYMSSNRCHVWVVLDEPWMLQADCGRWALCRVILSHLKNKIHRLLADFFPIFFWIVYISFDIFPYYLILVSSRIGRYSRQYDIKYNSSAEYVHLCSVVWPVYQFRSHVPWASTFGLQICPVHFRGQAKVCQQNF